MAKYHDEVPVHPCANGAQVKAAVYDGQIVIFDKHGFEALGYIDAVPVVHGKWSGCAMNWKCSSCKQNSRYTSNYCPNCGARMDGGDHGKE